MTQHPILAGHASSFHTPYWFPLCIVCVLFGYHPLATVLEGSNKTCIDAFAAVLWITTTDIPHLKEHTSVFSNVSYLLPVMHLVDSRMADTLAIYNDDHDDRRRSSINLCKIMMDNPWRCTLKDMPFIFLCTSSHWQGRWRINSLAILLPVHLIIYEKSHQLD